MPALFLLKLALGARSAATAAWRGIYAALRSLNAQGWIGLIAVLLLGYALIGQRGEARHWRKQSNRYEQLYRGEHSAHARTVANYRAAAEQARAADKANADRVRREQAAINERTTDELETRLADARARAERLRRRAGTASANPGSGGAAPVPGIPGAAGSAGQAAGEAGLSDADRLIATEQSIQLDELIKWVKRQAAVDPNGEH